jgi:hypothetical protein
MEIIRRRFRFGEVQSVPAVSAKQFAADPSFGGQNVQTVGLDRSHRLK